MELVNLVDEQILGMAATGADGPVMGLTGVEEDAEVLSVFGASLAGVAERSAQQIGRGSALSTLIVSSDGMVTVGNDGSFALTVLNEQTAASLVVSASQPALSEIASSLNEIQRLNQPGYA